MQDTETRPAAPGIRYPQRLRLDSPHQHGIVLDHTDSYAPLAGWCRSALPSHGARLAKVARLLVENAHQHSRSGQPGGTVRIVLDQTRHLLPHLYVTDQGPLNGGSIAYPRLEKSHPWSGLTVVEQLSVYWDWSWLWDGHHIRELTVQVVFDLTADQ